MRCSLLTTTEEAAEALPCIRRLLSSSMRGPDHILETADGKISLILAGTDQAGAQQACDRLSSAVYDILGATISWIIEPESSGEKGNQA